MGKIITMDYINQSGRWPTGCESVSAVMVLNYLGVLVTVDEFIEKYIECVPFEQRFGQRFGAQIRISALREVLMIRMPLVATRRSLLRQ